MISGEEGFSLIEIIVAVMLSSIILMMVYSAHRSIVSSINDLTGVADFYENVHLALSRVDHDISCSYYNKYNKKLCLIGENNKNTPYMGKINLVTIDHQNLSLTANPKKEMRTGDIHEIGYYLKSDKKYADLYTLIRRQELHYDDNPEEGGQESIILENVMDVRFEFRLRNDWTDTWDSRKYNKVPEAVKTTLKIRNFKGKEEEIIIITNLNMLK